ncbi:MAG: hypothetical protein ABIY48_03455 [Acidimicrobiales bacterium]
MIDPTEAEALVARDTELGLADAFAPTEGFRVVRPAERDELAMADGSEEPITNGQATAVAWTWSGVHKERSERIPYTPTGRDVEVHGLTVVTEASDGSPRFHRYVDWLSALAQIGVTLSDRPVFDEPTALEQIPDPPQIGRRSRSRPGS